MEPHSLDGAYSEGGSQVSWEDGERVFRRGWRLDENGKRRAVLDGLFPILVNQPGEQGRADDELPPLRVESSSRLGGNRLVERAALSLERRDILGIAFSCSKSC
jgi:hypothetical protein